MNKIKNIIKKVPIYGYIWAVLLIILQALFYFLGSTISRKIGFKPINMKIDSIDNAIKLIPIFIIPYIYSYILWFFAPIAISLTSKKNFINYLFGIIVSYIIGFIIFIFFPTIMSRVDERLYDNLGNDVLSRLIKIIYDSDGKEYGYNLFPSYHCLVSTYCYLGIRKQKEISFSFKTYTLIVAILICMSTIFTKQHYFADILGGVGIAIFTYIIIKIINPGEKITKLQEKE